MSTGRRNTQQRRKIREVFEQAGRPLNVEEVHAMVREEIPGLGIATVYRAINDLVEEEWLKPVELPGRNNSYELSELGHHHHFICNECDKVYDLHGCPGQMKDLVPEGFKAKAHDITIYGVCSDCNEPQQEVPAGSPEQLPG
ncbi:transcriptional repressor [bacterium]|nr:transcriptional repressor [bacterium]